MAKYGKKFQQDKIETCTKKRIPRVLKKRQLIQIVQACEDIRVVMVIVMGIFQGLRIREIVRLKWEEVDFEGGDVLILDSKNPKRYKSGYGKDDYVPINEMFIPLYEKWRAMNLKEEYVIPSDNRFGKRPDEKSIIRQYQKKFSDVLIKCNLQEVNYEQKNGTPRYKFHLHTLRHVCGTNLIRRGMSIYAVKDFLRHDRVETTEIYTRMTKEDTKEESHMAYAYPKSRIAQPNQPQIEVTFDKETLLIQKQILERKIELAKMQLNPYPSTQEVGPIEVVH